MTSFTKEGLRAFVEEAAVSPFQLVHQGVGPDRGAGAVQLRVYAEWHFRILADDGREHTGSFRKSFDAFIPVFWERCFYKIEWFPRIELANEYKVHMWWDSNWSFCFLAEPAWRIHSCYGGPLDLGSVDAESIGEPTLVIVRAKKLPS